MPQKKSFLNQVAHLFSGQVLYAFSQMLVLLSLAKLGGGLEAGKYVLALSTTAPIFMFFDLMLRATRATDHQFEEQFRNYVGLRACCLVLALIVTIVVCLVVYPAMIWVFLGVVLFRVGDSISNLSFGGFQRMQASDQIGKSLTIKGLVTIATVVGVAWLSGGNAVVVAFAMATIAISWAVAWDLPNSWRINEPDFPLSLSSVSSSIADIPSNLRIAKRSLPLGFDAFISSLAMNWPRYAIDACFGTAALGIFGLLSQLAFAIQMLVGAVGHTGVGILSERFRNRDRAGFWRLFNRMLAVSIILGLSAMVVGTLVIPTAIGYFLGPEYNNTTLMMLLLIASCLAGAQRTAGRATQACGSYFWYTAFDVVNIITSITCTYLLVKSYGLEGGAGVLVATFAAGLTVTLLHTYGLLWNADSDVSETPQEPASGDGSTI